MVRTKLELGGDTRGVVGNPSDQSRPLKESLDGGPLVPVEGSLGQTAFLERPECLDHELLPNGLLERRVVLRATEPLRQDVQGNGHVLV